MRIFALLLLLPMLALAQPPETQMSQQAFYEQSKARMQPMMKETLPAMKETLACMKQAEDQAAYEKCAEIMSALDKKMREKMGVPPNTPQGHETRMKDPKELEWNAETKQKMVKFLEHSITVGTAMNNCFDKSDTVEQMQQCIQASKSK